METIMDNSVIDILITVLVAVLSSTGLWKYLETKRDKLIKNERDELERDKNIKELIVCLTKAQICHTATLYIERGYISNNEADMLEQLFKPYHELGGNGSGEALYKQAMELPRKELRYENKE